MLTLPQDVLDLLHPLNDAGFQAYVVGGCVRDWLLHRTPKDWDICTNALPEEMKQVFRNNRLVETGLKHGTLTVILHHQPYEVTTFRVDGTYQDHRHPDSVSFVQDVRYDLARRDFTINAMAYHPEGGLLDFFGGQQDLEKGIIRAVGNPMARFEEDALRILRGLRFASVLGFHLEDATARAMFTLRNDLEKVAAERIRVELGGLVTGQGAGSVLRACWETAGVVLPEILPSVGFDQHTPYHLYDVWEHTTRAMDEVPPVETLRWAMLFHDLGKPSTFFLDEKGCGHAYGHQQVSARLAEQAMRRLRFDNATRELVVKLVEIHDWPLTGEEKLLRRRLYQLGEEHLWQLLEVQRADALAKGTVPRDQVEQSVEEKRSALRRLLSEHPCFSLKDLAVRGTDLLSLGLVQGKALGEMLSRLLQAVVDGEVENEREALLAMVKEEIGSGA